MPIPTKVFKKDSARRIDRVIDYFGSSLPAPPPGGAGRGAPPRRRRSAKATTAASPAEAMAVAMGTALPSARCPTPMP
jgi:hypothetical protein